MTDGTKGLLRNRPYFAIGRDLSGSEDLRRGLLCSLAMETISAACFELRRESGQFTLVTVSVLVALFRPQPVTSWHIACIRNQHEAMIMRRRGQEHGSHQRPGEIKRRGEKGG